jgi:pimeloyl-ACP methyl ester carboxylesterase
MAGFAGVKPQGNATFKGWTTEIARYIKENDLRRPVVVGHSMGGALALALAAQYPELIEKIIVVDALPCLAAVSNPAFKSEANPDCSAMVSQMVNLTDEQFMQMQKMTARGLSADTTMHPTIVDWSMRSDRNTLGKMFCDFLNTDLREELKSIKCPALILLQPYFKNIAGTIDSQYQNLKTANLQYATKGLHFIMFDDKQWYLNQVNDFIAAK